MIICISASPAIDRRVRVKKLALGAVNRAVSAESFAGGKAAHVAMAATAFGEEVRWIGFLGGAAGDQVERQLIGLGIDVRAVRTRSGTRCNDEIIDEDGTITEILEPGGSISNEEIEQMLKLCGSEFARAGRRLQVVLSGSLPPDVPKGFYADLIELARSHGGRTILDTSGDALLKAITAGPDLIKPNSEEAANATGTPLGNDPGLVEAVQKLHSAGARGVALSMGARGMVFMNSSSPTIFRGVPPKVEVNSTVGCGDAATAGFAVAAARDLDAMETLRLGVACGTANCLAKLPGQIRRSDVEALLPKISINEIEASV